MPRASTRQPKTDATKAVFQACCGTDEVAVSHVVNRGNHTVRGKVFGMAKSLRCRTDFLNMTAKEAIETVRVISPRHWFLAPLNQCRKAFYDEDAALATKEAREWNEVDGNRFRNRVDIARLTHDFFWEWMISSNVIAIWKRRQPNAPLPAILYPDADLCEVISDEGYLAVKVPTKLVSDEKMPTSKSLIISKNPKRHKGGNREYAHEWDFEICQNSKTSAGLEYPSAAVILDDLELLELFRVGDWVGAWKRREALRHHKLGYGVTSGQQAATKTGHASAARINATNKKMAAINGAGDLATNFDHEMSWLVFPKDHFAHEPYQEINRRLIYHGGYCAMMLMANKSQIESYGGYLLHMLRQETREVRKLAGDRFLHLILNSPSYLGDEVSSTPELVIHWSEQGLYSVDELLNRATKLGRPGYASPQTIREWSGLSDEMESQRMQQAHARREDFAPPYEYAQGMLPGMFPEEFPDGGSAPRASSDASPEGGRPS